MEMLKDSKKVFLKDLKQKILAFYSPHFCEHFMGIIYIKHN